MSDDQKPPKEPSNVLVHMPLPYLVTARVVVSEDAAPERHVVKLNAYGVLEAVLQASYQLGGSGFEDSKVKIESIEPDIPAFAKMFTQVILDAALGTRR